MTLPPRFSVCPHDTAKGVDRWALFHTLVNKHLRLGTRFLPSFDFKEFDEDLKQPGCVWAYLNPAQFLTARRLHGGEALVRPTDRHDKVYLVAPGDGVLALDPAAPRTVAAVDGYLLRIFEHCLTDACPQGNLDWGANTALAQLFRPEAGAFERRKAKSYAEVMTLVERKEVRFGVTYNEHFDELSPQVRARFQVVATIDIGLAHVVAVSAALPEDKKIALRQLLLEAHTSPEGKRLLEVFGARSFEPVPMEPYEMLARILA